MMSEIIAQKAVAELDPSPLTLTVVKLVLRQSLQKGFTQPKIFVQVHMNSLTRQIFTRFSKINYFKQYVLRND